MSAKIDEVSQLSVRELLGGDANYLIPMYQRNYAWEEGEITQLIQDVIDVARGSEDYHLGSLVVHQRKTEGSVAVLETIDGQQRLTTLALLASYLKKSGSLDPAWYPRQCVHFENRERSRHTLEVIFNGHFTRDPADLLADSQVNEEILNGYQLIQRNLPMKLKESGTATQPPLSAREFAGFLFNKVRIMRVLMPEDTDLNHYFEIMNSRGEQLEKHEVLKQRLMAALNGITDEAEKRACVACLQTVWEACSDMEQHVQMGFTRIQRDAVFGAGSWTSLQARDFEALKTALLAGGIAANDGEIELPLTCLISQPPAAGKQGNAEDEDAPARFNSVIDFPHFLLHVLRVCTKQDVPLDDKQLLSAFDLYVLKTPDPVEQVKAFTFNLLKCRHLFDRYVIKKEPVVGQNAWSLKSLKGNDGKASYIATFEDEESRISVLMLLNAFHVSAPAMASRHWLSAALNHVFWRKGPVSSQDYLHYLENVAKAFVRDRFLAVDGGLGYHDIIFRNNGMPLARQTALSSETVAPMLCFGQFDNFVFNYLDYLLWQEHRSDPVVKNFKFTFRSSVEHFYPRNPMNNGRRLADADLDSFGNLCLISHSNNSRLSNLWPLSKSDVSGKDKIDSVKQWLMMQDAKTWDEHHIRKHGDAMIDVLLKALGGG